MGNIGRPKAEISRHKTLNLRLTDFEYEEISKLAEKLKITKTELILRGVKLLEENQKKSEKVVIQTILPPKTKIPKFKENVPGVEEGEIVWFKDIK